MSSLFHKPWVQHLLILLLFLGLSVGMTYPLAFRAADTIINYGDPLLNTWIMAWDLHALTTEPFNLFHANNFYPYQHTLAYSENLLSTALLAAPCTALTGNPVLAHNLMTLLSFTLGAFCAFLLIRRVTKSSFGGIAGGIVFAFAHYRSGQVSHIQLLTSWWIPLAFYHLDRFLDERRNQDVLWFAGCFIAQAWASIYLGIFLAGAVGLYLLWALVTRRGLLCDLSLWRCLGAAGVLITVALAPLSVPYLHASGTVGTRNLEAQNGAALRDFLSAHPRSLVGQLSALEPIQQSPEHTLFPGFVCLALIAWAILKGRWNWRTMGFYPVLGLVSFVLSLGPQLHLTRQQPAVLEGLPYAIVHRYVPIVRAIRVPARLSLLVMLSFAVLTGLGAAALMDALRQRCLIFGGLVAAVMVIEYWAGPLPLNPIEVGQEVPSVYRWVGNWESDSVIFEFPAAESVDITGDGVSVPRLSRHQYFSVYHWQRLTMGYSGFYPPLFWESLDYGLHFPSHESVAYLRGLGARYLLIHDDELSRDERLGTHLALRRRSDVVHSVGRYGETEVYRLSSSLPVEPDVGLYVPSDAEPSRPYYIYVVFRLPSNLAWVSRQMSSYRLKYEWQSQTGDVITREVESRLPMVLDAGTTILPVSLVRPSTLPARLTVSFTGISGTVANTQVVKPLSNGPGVQSMGESFRRVSVPFGDDLNLTHVHLPRGMSRTAGDPLSLVLYWRGQSSVERELTSFIHILDQQGLKVAQLDTPMSPQSDLERHLVPLPWDLPPGSYDVVVGVYRTETHQTVGEPIELGTVDVEQPRGLPSMVQGPLSFRVGTSVDLLGYDLEPETTRPGEEFTVTLYWQCRASMEDNYKVFVHLLAQNGNILEQQDNQPRGGLHPTSEWNPGEVIVDRYRLTVPMDAQPGAHPLLVGMYVPGDDHRLPVRRANGTVVQTGYAPLGELHVTEGDGR